MYETHFLSATLSQRACSFLPLILLKIAVPPIILARFLKETGNADLVDKPALSYSFDLKLP
jgi:hypothetical protein